MTKTKNRTTNLIWSITSIFLFGTALKLSDLIIDAENCAEQDWICQMGFLFLPTVEIVALMGMIIPIMTTGSKYWHFIKINAFVLVATVVCLLHKHLHISPHKCQGDMFHLNEAYCEMGGILSVVFFLTTVAGLFFLWLLRYEVFLGGGQTVSK